ncbi:hypothetical protein TEA_012888 [Camellia sinensis var. sinensis]|uniref:Protein kinase domain-containing protein n=1 Tax=Camellia sinensis var. sinensis TaxID=542762 RepID=A0A4S4DPT0_CAMSN|nr:hypothetical protein TEA_012888 [Camellia sinensis var. sinensis]
MPASLCHTKSSSKPPLSSQCLPIYLVHEFGPSSGSYLLQEDARQRPDAKTLLLHPWIQNSRRVLQSSLRHSGTLRNIEEDGSLEAEILDGDDQSTSERPSAEKVKVSEKELLSTDVADIGKYDENNGSSSNLVEEITDNLVDDNLSDQVLTFAIHEKVSLNMGSVRLSGDNDVPPSHPLELHRPPHIGDEGEGLLNGKVGSFDSRRKNIPAKNLEGNGSASHVEHKSFGFGMKNQEYSPRKACLPHAMVWLTWAQGTPYANHAALKMKAAKVPVTLGGNELSRFSDTPGDASLDDLFHPLEKSMEDRAAEASTSASSSHVNQDNAIVTDDGKNDLATKLRATIAQKQLESDTGKTNGGDLLRLMMGVLKEDAIDIHGLGFDDKLPAENLFPVQAVEFSKLVGSLRPEESEDVIMSACQKLIAFFHQRPEQKIVFVTQYGLLPLLELLEVSRTRGTCSVLQVLNQIIKDNTDFQENASLVGLIPVVMSFAGPDHPREVRMEAAYFLQQLCQSSPLTLQMFIACRGIPVLVGFLEADYAKFREMVHLAIDGMWQVFKLQRSTPRNDFCRIAAKYGFLLRLINTLYSLNEATRLASISGGSGFPVDGLPPRPRSGPLDPNNPAFAQGETSPSGIDQPDLLNIKHGVTDRPLSTGTQEPSRSSASYSPDSRFFPLDTDRPQSSNAAVEASVASRLSDPTSLDNVANVAIKESSGTGSKERENLDRWKIEPSRAEIELKQQRVANSANRTSTDRAPKLTEGASNGFPTTIATQQENVRPLLSLLDKEPPSRHFSGQLEYVRHLSGLERHETILPLLHASNEKKANGLDFLMAEFAEVSGRGRDNANLDLPRISHKTVNKKVGPLTSNEGAASTSGLASQTASGVLSGSGVLNARPGSTTSSGLLSHMVSTFNADVAREYLEKVADLLLEFSGADTTVKSYMCSQSLLSRLFQMFNRIEPPILLKVLNALFNLCKINKRRQEQAAENGIIPHLMHFIMSDSPLKQYALPLLCDMAHASRNSREQLRAHGGLDVYLSLLEDELWSVTALDSIAVCLAHDNDNRKVEQALLKKEAVQKLVKFFQCCPEQHFVHILEPFLKIITKSSRINTTLAVNGLTPLLISRLDHQDAIARLNLLKLIKAVYEHHPRPKQLIVENDLPQKLQNLIEERRDGQRSGGQVLVKQMATSLLKALHINTVL